MLRPTPAMMNRRHFLRTAGSATALAALSAQTSPAAEPPTGGAQAQPNQFATMKLEGDRLLIETHTLRAEMTHGLLTSLRSRLTGEEFIRSLEKPGAAALELIYRGDEIVRVDTSKFGSITTHLLSDRQAEIVFHSWDGDGVITVSVDPDSGDILVEPSAYSSRPGVRGCRWNLTGLRAELELVAPFFQGVRLKLEDTLVRNTHWAWPFFWEAGLAILQGAQGGFWVHTQDPRYRYKAIQVGSSTDPHRIGFDTEAYGPIDQNLGAGGLAWRINVFPGDWTVPAERYREWLWRAYQLQPDEASRPGWIRDVRFAVSWCPGAPEVLEALARRLDPRHVLIHFPNWRTDTYD